MSFIFVAGLLFLFNTIESVSLKGSTPNIKEIVLGRCYEYQELKTVGPERKDCNMIWTAFHQAFAYKDPCNLPFEVYEPFFKATGMQEHPKSLFWTGTYEVAHVYSDRGRRYTTLEDTFAGYLVDGLTWCGKKTNEGIDYDSCPDRRVCNYTTAFWGLASMTFAKHARGTVRVMLHGSRVDLDGKIVPYRADSFFAKYELPYLQVGKVSELMIIVVHTTDPKGKSVGCDHDSIIKLKNDAEQRGLKVTCYEDPADVRHIMCTDTPSYPKCQFPHSNPNMYPRFR